MKAILVATALLFSTSAFASELIHCTLSLLAPMHHSPAHLWIAPMTGVYEFDYDPATELTVRVAVKSAVPNKEFPQYALTTADSPETAALSIEFSKTTPDGRIFEGDDFGVYLRLPNEKPGNSAWVMGGYTEATLSSIAITPESNGYVVMNCRL